MSHVPQQPTLPRGSRDVAVTNHNQDRGRLPYFLVPPFLSLPPAYQITHRLNATAANTAAVEVLAPSARQYTATGLKPESVYLFRITAQTRKGWGEAAEALVVTTEKRGEWPGELGGLRGSGKGCPQQLGCS